MWIRQNAKKVNTREKEKKRNPQNYPMWFNYILVRVVCLINVTDTNYARMMARDFRFSGWLIVILISYTEMTNVHTINPSILVFGYGGRYEKRMRWTRNDGVRKVCEQLWGTQLFLQFYSFLFLSLSLVRGFHRDSDNLQ